MSSASDSRAHDECTPRRQQAYFLNSPLGLWTISATPFVHNTAVQVGYLVDGQPFDPTVESPVVLVVAQPRDGPVCSVFSKEHW